MDLLNRITVGARAVDQLPIKALASVYPGDHRQTDRKRDIEQAPDAAEQGHRHFSNCRFRRHLLALTSFQRSTLWQPLLSQGFVLTNSKWTDFQSSTAIAPTRPHPNAVGRWQSEPRSLDAPIVVLDAQGRSRGCIGSARWERNHRFMWSKPWSVLLDWEPGCAGPHLPLPTMWTVAWA